MDLVSTVECESQLKILIEQNESFVRLVSYCYSPDVADHIDFTSCSHIKTEKVKKKCVITITKMNL